MSKISSVLKSGMGVKGLFVILIIAVFGAGIFSGQYIPFLKDLQNTQETKTQDKHIAFYFGVYDLVMENYWSKLTDEQLIATTRLANEKLTGMPMIYPTPDRATLVKQLTETMKNMSDDEKTEYVVQLSDIVLANLEPFGRSRLYSTKEKEDLKNTVNNITPEADRYADLGVGKDATQEEIKKTYESKLNELEKKEQTDETKQQIATLNQAYETLEDKDSRELYNQSGVEPTFSYKLLNPNMLYIKIKKFSPTTVEELHRVTSKVDSGETLNTLILDLRGNIGGAIDGLPYFLGPFIGNEQYAYQFFSRDEKVDFKTKSGWLPSLIRYKKIVILIDGESQSSAEVFSATLKKYNVGVLVGETTKGWGTIERVFPLEYQLNEKETYSAFLVHSITLREDGLPIEGQGVDPAININDPDWEKQLYDHFNYQALVDEVKKLINEEKLP